LLSAQSLLDKSLALAQALRVGALVTSLPLAQALRIPVLVTSTPSSRDQKFEEIESSR
jgi:hypothetical protein